MFKYHDGYSEDNYFIYKNLWKHLMVVKFLSK